MVVWCGAVGFGAVGGGGDGGVVRLVVVMVVW